MEHDDGLLCYISKSPGRASRQSLRCSPLLWFELIDDVLSEQDERTQQLKAAHQIRA